MFAKSKRELRAVINMLMVCADNAAIEGDWSGVLKHLRQRAVALDYAIHQGWDIYSE